MVVDRAAFVACKGFLKDTLRRNEGSVIVLVDDIVSCCSYVRRRDNGCDGALKDIFSDDSDNVFLKLDSAGASLECADRLCIGDGEYTILGVANKRCASLFCLSVLEPCIEDRNEMIAKYLVLSKADKCKEVSNRRVVDMNQCWGDGVFKTGISFSLENRSMALYKALHVFASRNIK